MTEALQFGGYGHTLYFTARKAARVSHSTSRAETNACVGGLQVAQLISSRMTELFSVQITGAPARPHKLLELEQNNVMIIPCDAVTDCMDLFELITGARGLTTDKTQRISVMSLREDRLTGRFRRITHVPTTSMLADGMTKLGVFPQLLLKCTTGLWRLIVQENKYIRVKPSVIKPDYSRKIYWTVMIYGM